jgi:signal peptidase I
MEWVSHLTEGLANLSIKTVLIAVGVMMLLLTFCRVSFRPKDQTAAWLVENLQVVLSVVVVVFLIIRPFLFQAFYIPSSSMEPTLLGPQPNGGVPQTTGDRLLVDKLVYRFFDPNRSDIVVFRAPPAASADQKEFIKRVIGLPGDTVEVVPPQLRVDGHTLIKLSNEPAGAVGVSLAEKSGVSVRGNVAELRLGYGNTPLKVVALPKWDLRQDQYQVQVDGKVELKDETGTIAATEGFSGYGGDPSVQGTLFTVNGDPRLAVVKGTSLEEVDGHVVINGEAIPEPYIAEAPQYAMAPRKLGKGEYFMMGDNRNNSNDSHVWGSLTRDRVIGRAEILFWPPRRFHILNWWLISVLGGLFAGYQLLQKLMGTRV